MLESEALFGTPRFERDGELVEGLDRQKTVPPIESLIAKYIWAETGVDGDGARGPHLEEGFELTMDNPEGPFEFPNVNGDISIFEGSGVLTGIRRAQPLVVDGPEAWKFEIDWPEDGDAMYPCEARVYVGKVLDDNGFPFLEVQFGDDIFQPYAYGKRQPRGMKAVGFSGAEKRRLNFITNAMQKEEGDQGYAEQRETDEARKIEAAKEKPKKQQQPQMSKGARKRANKARRLEEERSRLEREQSRFDLLKHQPATNNHGVDSGKEHTPVFAEIKMETGVKRESNGDQPPPRIKQEECPPPLTRSCGTKREREEESHTLKPVKRIKVEV